MHLSTEKLRETLFQEGVVDKVEYRKAENKAKRGSQDLIEVLLSEGNISEKYLTEILARIFVIPVIDLTKAKIETEALGTISKDYAQKNSLIVFDFNSEKRIAKVAMEDPGDLAAINFLKTKLDCQIEQYVTSAKGIKYVLSKYQNKLGEKFRELIAKNVEKARNLSGEIDPVKVAKEISVVSILDAVVEHALTLRASDIHIEPRRNFLIIRYRVDGIMQDIMRLPKVIHSFLVARVKVLTNLAIDEHRRPQDGRFSFHSGSGTTDIRVSVIPLLEGEKVAMRLLSTSANLLTLTDLGLNQKDKKNIQDYSKTSYGMILAVGPTGCGKTTTLYTILRRLNKPNVNIITIEDPIEYSIPGINQIQVNKETGVSFASGLRSIVRQDPDIILVGEIRDAETAEIAVHAAMTGHLVLSTLHTTDAAGAIPRLIDLGIEPFLIASTLNLIVAERLVRRICLDCIESYSLSLADQDLIKDQLEADGVKAEIPKRLYKGQGCKLCNYTGYKQRVGIFECLSINKGQKALVLNRAASFAIKQEAVKQGMTTMFEDGLAKMKAGITTLEEVMRTIKK